MSFGVKNLNLQSLGVFLWYKMRLITSPEMIRGLIVGEVQKGKQRAVLELRVTKHGRHLGLRRSF